MTAKKKCAAPDEKGGAIRAMSIILLDMDADRKRKIIRLERDDLLATAEGLADVGLVSDRALHLVIDGILDRANAQEVANG